MSVDVKFLQDRYKDFLSTSDEGKEALKDAVAKRKENKENRLQFGETFLTKFVKAKFIPKGVKLVKIPINPIGLNNQCHLNSRFFEFVDGDLKKKLGFNVLACNCGRNLSFELHSVNQKDGIYYDFTRDFNDEEEKYFLDFEVDVDEHDFVDHFSFQGFYMKRGKCTCVPRWNLEGNTILSSDDFSKLLDEVKTL